MELLEFIKILFANPMLLVSTVLTLAVILVNGWTDAPNAIATCVSTRAIEVKKAIVMAAVFNLLGVFIMTMIAPNVAQTVTKMVSFGSGKDSLIALCAAMLAIVIWATAAWYFGIPTSESHALIAGLSGAALAIPGGMINGSEWIKVIYGLGLSTLLGFAAGYAVAKIITLIFKKRNRLKCEKFFSKGQVAGGAMMAFMHGAQDGQKFMAIFIMGSYLAQGQALPEGGFNANEWIWLMVLCAVVMGLGTSIGGYKIIKSVGMDMVKLKPYQGFAADLVSTGCLLLASLTGIPVSTTHTKTTAIMGVGAARRMSNVNWSVVKELVLTWVFTFPGCGLLGYLVSKLFLMIF